MIPMIESPQVAVALAARWGRTRSLVLVSMVGLPVVLVLVCLMYVLQTSASWWSVIPVLVAGLSAFALVSWLRRDGLTDPASWFPATVLMTGSQLVFGVIPGFGVAVRSTTGTTLVVKALLAAGVLGAGSAWSITLRACRLLSRSPIAELGATSFRLVFRGESSRVVIGADRVDWTLRRSGGRLDAGVSFRHLHDVTVAAGKGSALVLHTSAGRWTVPVSEADAVREVLRLRRARWEQRVEAAIEQERERYHELLLLLGATRATASTADESVSVTVNSDGIATNIELTDGIRGRSPQLLSADLMVCLDQARTAVRSQVEQLMIDQYVTARKPRDLEELAQVAA
ncbi:hypothetical protein [Lentzea sp. NPDC051838]|uniref:YbaB/EbfC family nucleoid-associated protein n=1 Tax=Lentzea sp. NPDC051838 TaxID=3154849 RepID=UPI0034237119